MRRTEQVQGLRLMKFDRIYGRTHRGGLSQAEAAEVLVSTFRRWRDRYEAEGADGPTAAWAASRRGARRWTRWRGCWSCSTPATARPSTSTRSGRSRLQDGCGLQAHGRRRAAPRRGAHRRKRPRRALPGMMLQTARATSGSPVDLIVTMDDATRY